VFRGSSRCARPKARRRSSSTRRDCPSRPATCATSSASTSFQTSQTDYLGWGGRGVSGYIGTPGGRGQNEPSTQGFQQLPATKPRRFSVSYHLLALRAGAPRVRLQVWVDDGEEVPTVVPVWPTADWHEREAYDLLGISFEGHPHPTRILMDDDWEGHPLRKDYPIGGEPVRFSGEE